MKKVVTKHKKVKTADFSAYFGSVSFKCGVVESLIVESVVILVVSENVRNCRGIFGAKSCN